MKLAILGGLSVLLFSIADVPTLGVEIAAADSGKTVLLLDINCVPLI
ncbi:MAG: hypothetical protein CLLPBCKN_007328 [Chroococcidiopsis cubana SAG 39.79]|nr:hypothetical protein [Chroococcidiopsis cubana]MDZ4877893.1 hypothetical protein [Chroococcidiopsis cubana SAG 39.79]